jgi:hypothetical protein
MKNNALKSVSLKQVGWLCSGTCIVNLWGEGQGSLDMKCWTVMGQYNRKKIIDGVNDAEFGVESICSARISIYRLFENGYKEFYNEIRVDKALEKAKKRNLG